MYEYRATMTANNGVHVEVKDDAAPIRPAFGDAVKIFVALCTGAPFY
jgi:hypothetical protein